MPRVLFSVTYTIDSDRLAEYEELIRRMKVINAGRDVEYNVFRGKNNQFTELTVFPSEEAFEESDDMMEDETANDYINRINAMANDTHYSTLHEFANDGD
ncbi:MAG: hypothetical protein JNL32_16165 [Candidatus Kapabacteria bacterium]|nr:hypothetical protein [Candidatus Kapabacteria bacterium]